MNDKFCKQWGACAVITIVGLIVEFIAVAGFGALRVGRGIAWFLSLVGAYAIYLIIRELQTL